MPYLTKNEDILAEKNFLSTLISLSKPFEDIKKDSPTLFYPEWNSDLPPLGWVTRQDIIRLLEYFLADQLTNKQVSDWAEYLYGRETVEFEIGYQDLIDGMIGSLASQFEPDVLGLSKEVALQLINDLKNTPFDKYEDDDSMDAIFE